ncbi:MAG: aspartate aminotransferase family protein [Candidatus Riflebacteria bacterium]|nr:aspartate aminotransferase family protein [Candidatus Riflebacteria bacterium]
MEMLGKAMAVLARGFADLPAAPEPAFDRDAMEAVLLEAAQRLQDNFPYFHPLYAGQMLKPPHPVARLAYALAMTVNPNNHALDGGRASSAMEKEAVATLAGMIGWDNHLGHLTGGGTMANLEALWVAGRLHPGRRVLASTQAHYTHARLSEVLGLPFTAVPADRRGRLDLDALDRELARGDVGTVVATIGTTATGAVDPLPGILERRARHGFRVHADAAYGGYFRLLAGEPADGLGSDARAAFQRLGEADSLVVDPHKHGLQPYGCGCILFRDPSVGRFYRHDSPYTYFSSSALHLGEISLECSRPGAAAVALWATQRLLPPVPGGAFARDLARGREAALGLYERLRADRAFLTAFPPELDIVVWAMRAPSVTAASARARAVFEEAGRRGLHLALAGLPVSFFDLEGAGMATDAGTITCLRSVLMKPEHLAWLDRLWDLLRTSL